MTTIQMFLLGISFGILLTLNILPEGLNNKLLKFISYISFKSIFSLILIVIMLKAIQYSMLSDQSISWYQLATSSDGVGDVGAVIKDNTSIVKDNNLIVKNPSFSLSIPQQAWDTIAGVMTAAGGAAAGVKLAKQMPTPVSKAIALGGTMLVTKTVGTQARLAHQTISNSNISNSKFVSYITDNIDTVVNTMPSIKDHPFILLENLPFMSSLQLLFLSLMFYSFLALFISSRNIDLANYLPNNKLGTVIAKWSNKLVYYWGGSALFVFILSSINMFVLIWANKLSIILVISNLN